MFRFGILMISLVLWTSIQNYVIKVLGTLTRYILYVILADDQI